MVVGRAVGRVPVRRVRVAVTPHVGLLPFAVLLRPVTLALDRAHYERGHGQYQNPLSLHLSSPPEQAGDTEPERDHREHQARPLRNGTAATPAPTPVARP